MFVHFNRKNMLLFYNPDNKTFVVSYRSTNANILNTNVLLCTVNICAVTQGTFCFAYMMCFCPSPAEMGLFPTTQFPGNKTPISLQVRCPWWRQCGVWRTHRRVRWDTWPTEWMRVCVRCDCPKAVCDVLAEITFLDPLLSLDCHTCNIFLLLILL